MEIPLPPRLQLPIALIAVAIAPLSAQNSGFDFTYGRWWHDSASVAYSMSYFTDLIGPVSYSIGLTHSQLTQGERTRQTGGELTLGMWRDGAGLYLAGGAGLDMGHTDGRVNAQWSAGAGYAVRPVRFLSFALEGRYRVEDQRIRGFWRLQPEDRRGIVVQMRLAVRTGGTRRPVRPVARAEAGGGSTVPPPPEIAVTDRGNGTGAEAAELRAQVVRTALDAMGSPYRWGGNDVNGFDCSGLIQYAYGEHGLILPRTSRDQARMGMQVALDLQSLLPGDLLGFAGGGSGVTHVGLYVGEGLFIHSASDGVRLTSLLAEDGDARWWRQRWASARRVIN